MSGETNVDTITGFAHRKDTIALDAQVFDGLGTGALSADAFHAGSQSSMIRATASFTSLRPGRSSYDPDGSGGVAPIRFAKLAEPTHLTHADFLVV